MSTVTEVKTGLKDALAVDGVRTYATATMNPTPPALVVHGPTRWTYDADFDGTTTYTMQVVIYVNPAGDTTRAQTAIDAFLAPAGSRSIRALVDADRTLGGVAHYAHVVGGSDYARLVDVAGTQLLSAVVEVEVRSA